MRTPSLIHNKPIKSIVQGSGVFYESELDCFKTERGNKALPVTGESKCHTPILKILTRDDSGRGSWDMGI